MACLIEKVDFDIDYSISQFHTQNLIENHQKKLNKFQNQNGIKITLRYKQTPQFRGFDPMHAEAINDSTVLHKTFLNLQGNKNNQLFISNKQVLTNYTEQIWFVNTVTLFINKENLELTENKQIIIKTDNISINWEGEVLNTSKKEIEFLCN
jgi:hypothetical protein